MIFATVFIHCIEIFYGLERRQDVISAALGHSGAKSALAKICALLSSILKGVYEYKYTRWDLIAYLKRWKNVNLLK